MQIPNMKYMNTLLIILQYYHQNQDGVSNDVGNHKMKYYTFLHFIEKVMTHRR